jgi:hypothetical protein
MEEAKVETEWHARFPFLLFFLCRMQVHMALPLDTPFPMTSRSSARRICTVFWKPCHLHTTVHGSLIRSARRSQSETALFYNHIRGLGLAQGRHRRSRKPNTRGTEPPTWRRNLLFLSLRHESWPQDTLHSTIAAIRVRRGRGAAKPYLTFNDTGQSEYQTARLQSSARG